jgi:N-acetylneuraminic acid mutarotase
MTTARVYCAATMLPSGKVLVTGGQRLNTKSITTLASAELYDPGTGSWSTTGKMALARVDHTATLLQNGKVLVAGGSSNLSAELYDPATGRWSVTGSMSTARFGHTATLLQNGKVLVVGGSTDTNAELYDPATGEWSVTGATPARSAFIGALLGDGNVLIAGGHAGHYPTDASTNSSALYDPSSGLWPAGSNMNTARESFIGILLPDGQVLVAGGLTFSSDKRTTLASAEIYTPGIPAS